MSCVIIYPMELSPVPFSDPPENMTGSHIRFLFGLASDGVYMASSVTRETVVSYTAFPPLPEKSKIPLAVSLCCTIPGVTSAGRYPAPCPAKPGLSSPGPFRSCQPRLHILLRHKTEHQTVNNHITKLPYCPSPNLRNHDKRMNGYPLPIPFFSFFLSFQQFFQILDWAQTYYEPFLSHRQLMS